VSLDHPIGLYDSGIGGLSVVREIFRQLPNSPVIYFGDTARVPYGPRPADEILAFNREIARGLVQAGARTLVIACNTSSAIALRILRKEFSVPIVGLIEPGAHAAVAALGDRTGGIAVIATEGTVMNGAYGRAIKALRPTTSVRELACPDLVPLVESGAWDGPDALAIVLRSLAPLLANPPSVLVLGCTHYPHLAPIISRLFGPAVTLVNPALGAAHEAARVHYASSGQRPSHRFMVSGHPESFYQLATKLLPGAIEQVEQVRFGAAASQPQAGLANVSHVSITPLKSAIGLTI
jgi:glutamate racemase